MPKKNLGELSRSDRINQRIGARIRRCRRLKGCSQQQLARAVGMTYQQLQRYERGSASVPAARLQEIATAMEVSILSFFEEDTDAQAGPGNEPVQRLGELLAAVDNVQISREIVDIVRVYGQIRESATRQLITQVVRALGGRATEHRLGSPGPNVASSA